MTTKEAMTRVSKRLEEARARRLVANRETDVLEALYEALRVNNANAGNLGVILDALQEDES